ncbi:MAG: 4Fe-4S binding protein [Planctomycetota bacterium]
MTETLQPLLEWGRPFASPLVALLALLVVPPLVRRADRPAGRVLAVAGPLFGLSVLYHLAAWHEPAARWLGTLESPLIAALVIVVLPAIYLPRGRARRIFLLVPALGVLLFAFGIWEGYRTVPAGEAGFYGILVRPGWLMGGVVSLLVLVQPLLSLHRFRWVVRVTALLILGLGGWLFRESYEAYRAMEARRPMSGTVMNVSEMTPVTQRDDKQLHLPGAVCRFVPDGGYVQGCNIELAQRVLQTDFTAAAAGDAGAAAALHLGLGSLLFFLVLSFLTARWACGWICPLATVGDGIDWCRRKLGLTVYRPSRPVKLAYLFSGIGIGGLTLAMARATAHLDAEGRFAGCKIPIYPFCKICPHQSLCPASMGAPLTLRALPGTEWAWGFFRYGLVAVAALFLVSFAMGRRLWCRFCPIGMVSGLFNRGGLFRLRKNAEKCNRCGVCREVCPVDIDLVRAEMQHEDVSCYDCHLCLRCVEQCPRDGCLSLEHAGVTVTESRFR